MEKVTTRGMTPAGVMTSLGNEDGDYVKSMMTLGRVIIAGIRGMTSA